jgi:hypothetical protein
LKNILVKKELNNGNQKKGINEEKNY